MKKTRGPYNRKYPLDATERICSLCNIEKPVSAFPANTVRSNGYVAVESRCLDCRRPTKNEYTRLARFTRYGLTEKSYYAMLTDQKGLCKICEIVMSSPYIDHCHVTGRVRGLLCHTCNVGLGMFKDDPKFLQNAIKYLI